MLKNLHAGYILSVVRDQLWKNTSDHHWEDVVRRLCDFTLEGNLPDDQVHDPAIAVLSNIISRGLPTLASILLEDTFLSVFGISRKTVSELTGEIIYKPGEVNSEMGGLLERSFAVIDPRLT